MSEPLPLDLHNAAFQEDPAPTLAWLREHDPVHRSAYGYWLLTRYHDVAAAFRDARLTGHTRIRQLVQLAFSRAAMIWQLGFIADVVELRGAKPQDDLVSAQLALLREQPSRLGGAVTVESTSK